MLSKLRDRLSNFIARHSTDDLTYTQQMALGAAHEAGLKNADVSIWAPKGLYKKACLKLGESHKLHIALCHWDNFFKLPKTVLHVNAVKVSAGVPERAFILPEGTGFNSFAYLHPGDTYAFAKLLRATAEEVKRIESKKHGVGII